MLERERVRQIFCACEQGDVDSVITLLDQGCDVDSLDEDENTLLQVASANGHDNVVRLLIMRGAGLDKRNVFGWTPLLQASRYGHSNVVALLIQHQADIQAKNRYGASALTLAARGGHIQTVKLLVESGVDLNGASEGCEFTPLLAAALHGHDAVLRFLLDRGCDMNFCTPTSGLTPLMLAALNGHMTTAQILIEKGGDPNVVNVGDKTALGIATVRGKREVRGYLDRKTTNKPKVSPDEIKPDIIEAAKHGDKERIREILDQNPSQKDASSPQDGATPLMFAAMTGRLDVAELLVQRGCDINKQDLISGWTALMQATYHGKKQVAMFLLNAGADVSVQAKNGCTAFDMASLIDDVDTELLRMLASKALHVNKADKGKKGWSKHNNGAVSPSVMHPEFSEDNPKSGLKGWWNRMSNRFRNLKLGRTFTMTNRLAPMPLQTSTSVQDLTLKGHVPSQPSPLMEPKQLVGEQSTLTMTSYESMLLETKKSASVYTLDINPPNSAQSSETLKPVKPPFLPPPTFALDGPEHAHRFSTNWRTYKAMTDDHITPDRSHAKMYPPSRADSGSQSARLPTSSDPACKNAWVNPLAGDVPPALHPHPFPLDAWPTNPSSPASGRLNPSPAHSWTNPVANPSWGNGEERLVAVSNPHGLSSSSGGGGSVGSCLQQRLAARRRVFANSSVVVVGAEKEGGGGGGVEEKAEFGHGSLLLPSPHIPGARSTATLGSQQTPSLLFMPRKSATASSAFRTMSNTTSPNSSTSGSSSITPQRSSRGRSTSSKDSTTSTLTPSPSPTPGKSGEDTVPTLSSLREKDAGDDELSNILKKLSLEKYSPIFEEQEVDMEAFLTLTDEDLKELGIPNVDSRRQILKAIRELNSGKGRERQQFVDTMTSFNTTLKARTSSELGTENDNLMSWNIQDEPDPHLPSAKSRSS
ncbi:ankyrin repeat and SAM domain-containing protein 6-like isoform X2 [Babylonia areolata]|uniref:ankyrin repeat and SAM domain-containing protein 6-like isoform X2 n=1 Tax=Babylonia areolata TaxID=304850 RepID=UPI003FD21E53